MSDIKKILGIERTSIKKMAGLSFVIDSYTKLLLHLDNNVTDSEATPKTVTNYNVTFSDSIYKFGTHSAYFRGSDAHLTIPDSDDWDFGTGDFTIDLWMYCTNETDDFRILIDVGGYDVGVRLAWDYNSGYFNVYIKNNALTFICGSLANNWHHVALVRTGTTVKMFVDGTQIGSNESNNSDITSLTLGVDIGSNCVYTNHRYLGYLDEIRISKGIARWTSNFTPPTSQYGEVKKVLGVSN